MYIYLKRKLKDYFRRFGKFQIINSAKAPYITASKGREPLSSQFA